MTEPIDAGATLTGALKGSLALAAGAHLAAFAAHSGEGFAVGGFFIVVGVLQLAAAVRVQSPTAHLRAAIVAGNLALLALWAVSRTAGLPFGSHAGAAEPFGPLDLAATAAEAVAVAAVLMLPRARRLHAAPPAWLLVFFTMAVAAAGVGLVPASHDQHRDAHGTAPSGDAQQEHDESPHGHP